MNTYFKRYISKNGEWDQDMGAYRLPLNANDPRTSSSMSFISLEKSDGEYFHEYGDVLLADDFMCWNAFMMYWPALAFYALIGKE